MSKYYQPVPIFKGTATSLKEFEAMLHDVNARLSKYLPKDVSVTNFPGNIGMRLVYWEEEPVEHQIRELLVGFCGPDADRYLQWFDDQQKEMEELRKKLDVMYSDIALLHDRNHRVIKDFNDNDTTTLNQRIYENLGESTRILEKYDDK